MRQTVFSQGSVARNCSERRIVATTDQKVSGVPGRYASALFELASEEKAIDEVAVNLASLSTAIADSDDLKRLVRSPVFSTADQIAALEAICAKAKITGPALNFVRLVARNRRLAALPAMIDAFNASVAASRGETAAEVVSAEKLSAAHIKDLKAALKASLGRDVTLTTRVDSSILGGLIVKVGSRMMDNSLKTKLSNLKIAMKGTA
ncbi:MAG: F0F1 ATP synthase subunit delta [Alphaproteobacteria bacterium]|nr:F0F1 ATP synthase subunit delta [Alphaproteobacteria bacterium]